MNLPTQFPMTFFWPDLLWLLLAVPLLVALYFWLLRRRKKLALRFASLSIVKEAMGAGGQIRRARERLCPLREGLRGLKTSNGNRRHREHHLSQHSSPRLRRSCVLPSTRA